MRIAERAERRDRGDDHRGRNLADVGLAALAPVDVAVRFCPVRLVGRDGVLVAVDAPPMVLEDFVAAVEADRRRKAEVRRVAAEAGANVAYRPCPGRVVSPLPV